MMCSGQYGEPPDPSGRLQAWQFKKGDPCPRHRAKLYDHGGLNYLHLRNHASGSARSSIEARHISLCLVTIRISGWIIATGGMAFWVYYPLHLDSADQHGDCPPIKRAVGHQYRWRAPGYSHRQYSFHAWTRRRSRPLAVLSPGLT